MSAWKPFTHEGTSYVLSHLHPFVHTFKQAEQVGKPERSYPVQVIFSLHCFTRGADGIEEDPKGPLGYADSREMRIFDFGRYAQSRQLPEIVRALPMSPCFHTNHGNFFTVRLVNAATGQGDTYEVYFTVSRSSSKVVPLNLFVQSAYVRDRLHANRPARKKIGFFVILHNILNGRPIKVPK
ncbi:hypothetical protein [Variovorax sp. 67-131]|uniref:hypothetical protein n=1 Tax=unclassified Variovorax TaxID=663243 RepID=UPI00092A037C|nr:hypothetical protein [Variovorax sp. 67-131]OJZ06388.1 MAG: hypothetical protein BGP22_07385 [Variovorax sp. 67-131]